jgi:membrane protein
VRQWVLLNLPAPLRLLPPFSFATDLLLSSLLAFVAALALLWVLPSHRIRLRPLLPGAVLIGISLTLLNVLVGRSLLSLGTRYQAYGVVGGVLVLTLWVWAGALIFYYGQCLSVVFARSRFGHRAGGHPYVRVAAAALHPGEDDPSAPHRRDP